MGPNGLRAETRRLSLLRKRRESPLFKGTLPNPFFFFPSIMDFRSGFKGRICFVVKCFIFVINGGSSREKKCGEVRKTAAGTVPDPDATVP